MCGKEIEVHYIFNIFLVSVKRKLSIQIRRSTYDSSPTRFFAGITISVIFLILYDQDRQEFHEKFPRRYEAFYNLRKTGRRRSFLRQLSNMYSPCSPLEEISTPHGFHFLQRGTNDGTLEEAKYDLVGNG